MGIAVGDYDNDGYQDLYVTNFGPNLIYRNNGDGTFTDVSKRAGVDDKRWGASAALFDAVPNEMSAAYNRHLKKHIAIHTYQRENKLVIRTAPKITGPWSEPQVFYRPQKIRQDDLFNAGKEHPELARQGGRTIYVTYINSSVYVPHLLEITLAG